MVNVQSRQKIIPFLWFDANAEEAIDFYISVFRSAKVTGITRYGDSGPGPKGSVMSITFQLEGQDFYTLNWGPVFTFSQAISFFVNCETQKEVDHLWEKLSEGGEKQPCGWLKDRFGVSWQVIPVVLGEMLGDKDPVKADRVMKAMLKMTKIDIASLERAFRG